MSKTRDNRDALATFIARKIEIDTILAHLTALSAEHFNRAPNDVSWADVRLAPTGFRAQGLGR